jgi:superfamily II DNA helicase RecQ
MSQTQYTTFRYAVDQANDLTDLNEYLAREKVVQVEKHVVVSNGAAWLVFVVETLRGGAAIGSDARTRRSKVVDEAVAKLDTDQRVVFDRLRDYRKIASEKENIPAYSVFSNEQLLSIVRERVCTRTALESVKGLGQSRLEKYGAAMLDICRDVFEQGGAGAQA